MGFDIHVHIFGGFKIPLSVAFASNLLSPNIMEEDDYQLIGEEPYKNEIIDKHALSSDLKDLLKENWNIYIVTSSQQTFDFENSYFILFDTHQNLINGRIPDYATGTVTNVERDHEIWYKMTNIPLAIGEWKYDIHWVVESSY